MADVVVAVVVALCCRCIILVTTTQFPSRPNPPSALRSSTDRRKSGLAHEQTRGLESPQREREGERAYRRHLAARNEVPQPLALSEIVIMVLKEREACVHRLFLDPAKASEVLLLVASTASSCLFATLFVGNGTGKRLLSRDAMPS